MLACSVPKWDSTRTFFLQGLNLKVQISFADAAEFLSASVSLSFLQWYSILLLCAHEGIFFNLHGNRSGSCCCFSIFEMRIFGILLAPFLDAAYPLFSVQFTPKIW